MKIAELQKDITVYIHNKRWTLIDWIGQMAICKRQNETKEFYLSELSLKKAKKLNEYNFIIE